MRFRAAEIAAACAGALAGPDVDLDGASIDSRTIRTGQLFVPIVAARDGHAFIAAAIAAGAPAYLTAQGAARGETATAIEVDDTARALTALGRWGRERLPDLVAGITGSVGKTSTKDFLAAALSTRYRTAASERSFNNELGVPLTLLDAPDDTEAVVVEMGTRGIGHIAALCEIARPTIAVVTNVGACHLELLGSLDGVARAKRELVEALPASGTAVLNAEDERVLGMAASAPAGARVVTYGLGAGDVRAVGVRVDDELRVAFGLESPWGATDVRLETRGAHQVPNALAAAAAALASGVAVEEIAAGLARTALSPWRMEVRRAAAGALVVNDAYNANPASVEAALHALARLPARRRIAVLGPMLELGDVSAAEHARVGSLARQLGIDRVFAVGAPAYGAEDVADVSAALDALGALGPLREGDVVLVKASRAAGLERLAAALVGEREEAAWSPS